MRPLRLELSGFGPFREQEVIEFGDADLFALTGPTGAGKSSVMDAICFALYGAVPRHGRRAVAPAITQGKQEARIGLHFTIGEEDYQAVRVIRRTRGGATTKEARLERGGEVLAGNADEVTAKVEEIFGLSFEQFTKCVVLPQGEFARFLHDKPADRQDLLVRILDLGLYENIASRARERATEAQLRAEILEGRLAGHTTDPKEIDHARSRVGALEKLKARITEDHPILERLAADLKSADREAKELSLMAAAASAIQLPEGLAELADQTSTARKQLKSANSRLKTDRQRRERLDERRESLKDLAQLRRASDAFKELEKEQSRLADARADREKVSALQSEAAAASSAVATESGAAARRVLHLRELHSAAALAAHLEVGERCPVCLQDVEVLPNIVRPVDLDEAIQAEAASKQAATSAEADLNKVLQEQAAANSTVEGHLARIAQLEGGLGGRQRGEVEEGLASWVEFDELLEVARKSEREASELVETAERLLAGLFEEERRSSAQYIQARDRVVALGPPDPTDDPFADWQALNEWAVKQSAGITGRAKASAVEASELQAARNLIEAELVRLLKAAGIDADSRPRDQVVDALAEARADADRLKNAAEEAARLEHERKATAEASAVAKALADHLSARGFEKWLLTEAIELLVAGANLRLGDLSRGRYSLSVDSKLSFEVVDHQNAGEARSVRTLSGGETFLVSLALALSLADQLAGMASLGKAPLESIFLDEGFGTLDAETLEVVASVIHDIGAAGKTVGLVTHVSELADQVPVQFVVTNDGTTASVKRLGP